MNMAEEKGQEVSASQSPRQGEQSPRQGDLMSGTRSRMRPRSTGLFQDFDRLFEDMLPRAMLRSMPWEQPVLGGLSTTESRIPRVDVLDRDKDLLLRAEVPGVKREDLDISVTDNTVTIKGQSQYESEQGQEEGDYYRCEISRAEVQRTVTLPSEVDADKAEARFDNGILELTLPKVKEAHRRKIKVQ